MKCTTVENVNDSKANGKMKKYLEPRQDQANEVCNFENDSDPKEYGKLKST